MGNTDAERLHQMLSAERRRVVLDVLAAADEPLAVTEVARRLLDRQTGERATDRSPADVDSVVISLRHVHLPKLVEGGLIRRFEDGRYVVTRRGTDVERAARAFERSLDAAAGPSDDGPGPLGNGRMAATDADAEDR